MFVSTYDRLIEEGMVKGEAIGIQKGIQTGEAIGQRLASLHLLTKTILKFPALSDVELTELNTLPLAFVKAFRKPFEQGNLRRAQKIAVGAFADLPAFGDTEAEKVNEIVKAGMKTVQKRP